MPLPYSLQQPIEQAYTAVQRNSRHELRPFFRSAIYRAIMALGEPLNHQVRGKLALLTAQHVLSTWEIERPTDSWPQRVLAMAKEILEGEIPLEIGAGQARYLESYIEADDTDADLSEMSLDARYVRIAAVEALFEASRVYSFFVDEVGEDSTYAYDPDSSGEISEDEIDYTCTDTAGWASYAYAEGTWEPSFDPIRSKEFWEWWLMTAIPEAWITARG